MKKLLLAILFLGVSLTSYAPITYLSEEEKENSKIRTLFTELLSAEVSNIKDYPVTFPVLSEDSIKVSSVFGMRHDPFDGLLRNHSGIDIVSHKEAKIVATASGTIEKVVFSNYGYGNYVLIRHNNGIRTRYAHLRSINVEEGQFVNRFQQIGVIGKTGRATGIHLHYEILDGLKTIDPTSIFNVNSVEDYLSTLQIVEKYVKSNYII